MGYDVPHLIAGKKITAGIHTLNITCPADGKVIGNLTIADTNTIDQAVQAAKLAFATWSQTGLAARSKIMFRFKALLDQHSDELAELVTTEHGKTLIEAKGSVQRGIEVVDYACGIMAHMQTEYTANVAANINTYALRQPLGVCVGITPFNFPAMIPLWMFPMAIACGNTFILKPSEKNPSCALRIVELAHAAGVPAGVVNVLQGDKTVVDQLITHKDIKAVSFVGSSLAAEHVYKTAIQHNKRAQAFGGAKNHCVVMPDANLDQAAEAIVQSAYGSAGERCMALSAVIAIGDSIADSLIERMHTKIKKLRIGEGHAANIDMGPLISAEHKARVTNYIEQGCKEGARLVADGREFSAECGYFLGASLFDGVNPSMKIYQDEIFGPVLCVLRVKDLTTALQLINEHRYGNGTAIFTRDGAAAKQFAEQVQVGMVGINVPVPVPVTSHSFGGWKQSIFADIGMYGQEAIRFYTKLKTVSERWPVVGE